MEVLSFCGLSRLFGFVRLYGLSERLRLFRESIHSSEASPCSKPALRVGNSSKPSGRNNYRSFSFNSIRVRRSGEFLQIGSTIRKLERAISWPILPQLIPKLEYIPWEAFFWSIKIKVQSFLISPKHCIMETHLGN